MKSHEEVLKEWDDGTSLYRVCEKIISLFNGKYNISNDDAGNVLSINISTMMHRCVFSLISVLFSLCTYSQSDIATQLYDVLVSKDMTKGEKLINKITDKDIANMPDSVLLDYHYLAGAICNEKGKTEEVIDHLLKAKDLCENKVGIFNGIHRYLEIVRVLGESCEDQGKNEGALLLYEEGIVKAFAFWQTKDKDLQEYIKMLQDNAADIFEKQGHLEMARYIRSEKPLDYEGSFDYARDLLKQAMNYYINDQGEDGVPLLDKAKEIFKKSGEKGEEMMQPLYRGYLLCYSSTGDVKKIDALLKSKGKKMFYDGSKSYLSHDLGEIIAHFVLNNDIQTATKYYDYLIKEHDDSYLEDVQTIERLGHTIDFFKQAYCCIDSLKQVRNSYTSKSYEWGITSLQLANQLIRIHRYTEGNEICEDIYAMSSQLTNDSSGLHYAVLMNLVDYNIIKKNFGKAIQFIKEQLTWLDAHNIPTDNEERGWCYDKLGIAYMNDGKYDESVRMLNKAENIIVSIYNKDSEEYATILHNKGRLAQLQGRLDEAKIFLSEAKRLQIAINGKPMDRTEQYLNEVEHAIKVRL